MRFLCIRAVTDIAFVCRSDRLKIEINEDRKMFGVRRDNNNNNNNKRTIYCAWPFFRFVHHPGKSNNIYR